MQSLPLLLDIYPAASKGLSDHPVITQIPAFHEQLGARLPLSAQETVTPSLCHRVSMRPCREPSPHSLHSPGCWGRLHSIMVTPQLGLRSAAVPLASQYTSGPRMSTGRASSTPFTHGPVEMPQSWLLCAGLTIPERWPRAMLGKSLFPLFCSNPQLKTSEQKVFLSCHPIYNTCNTTTLFIGHT